MQVSCNENFYDLVLSHFTNKTKSLAKAFKKGRQNQGIITCVYIFASVNIAFDRVLRMDFVIFV